MSPSQTIFQPVEGAIVDLRSLQAIAAISDHLLSAWLELAWPAIDDKPAATGLVLSGLEMDCDWANAGPPGTRRPNSRSESVVITPGKALITSRDGSRYLLSIDEPLAVPWPSTSQRSAVQGVLVLEPLVHAAASDNVVFARKEIGARFGFVRSGPAALVEHPYLLPLASSVGNGRDWATDLRRIWQPEHEAIRILLKRFEGLERTVWRAEPEGSVWDRQVLGRNWVRYQTVAASAIQATRIALGGRATTTLDRVRMLNGLFEQLHGSVERAATELLQLIGPAEGAGPYRDVGAMTLRGGR